ncbi:MAG: response regulator transcription factor [Saprospiraceae bacterium]|nr:response regulator transcription factor [Saprospiraceae bacterium]
MTIRVLVVEDEALVAEMIREALSPTDFNVRAVAFSKDSALKYLADNPFDVALLDINLNGKFEGIDVGRTIRDSYRIPFLYLTAHADDQTLQNAKLTRPSGYIVKPFTERELIAGLEVAMYNARLQKQAAFALPDLSRLNQYLAEPLSAREGDVLHLIFEGKSNAEMAGALFVSVNTVKTHLMRLYGKLGVNSRTAVIARVREIVSR